MTYKDFEVWTLMNLVDLSIILGIAALGICLVKRYLGELEKYLSLKVTIEIWQIASELLVDLCLLISVIFGYMVLNPDIFADIKIAVPFIPFATVMFATALIIRLFYGGHSLKNKSFMIALWFIITGNLSNFFGYTLVMEAASGEYLAKHPSAFWQALKNMRSNQNLELAQVTFWIFGPLLFLIFVWALYAGIRQLRRSEKVRGVRK